MCGSWRSWRVHSTYELCLEMIRRGMRTKHAAEPRSDAVRLLILKNSSAMDVLQGPKYVSKCSTNTAISTAAFMWNLSLSGKMTNKYIETYISNDLFSLRLFFTLLDPNLPSIQFLSLQLNFYILSLDFRCCINTFYNAYISAVCKLTKKNEK